MVPSLLAVLDPGDLAGVGTLVVGSERVSAQIAATWGPGRRLFNAYGPTETTVISCTAALDPAAGQPPPIGSPVAGTRVHVLDRHLGPVPAGIAGDLLIGGAQVARGYAGRPGLTAERFVADPLAGDGSRLYRTGDRARWRADGQLEFLGRADDQVKIRGFRVEPGEVEAVLAAHPALSAAVVTADGGGTAARLVAYLVPADPSAGIPPAAELRAHLGQQLPEFMIPAVFTELAALPLTPSGKLDRAALPGPDARPGLAGGYVAPATPAQELLAGIWARVLGVDRPGASDSFFDLGGHSLLATQMISRIGAVFGAEVTLADLFDQPTIAGLATVIEGTAPGVAVPPVTPAGRGQRLPLSFGQQRLWFLHQLDPGSVEYSMPSPVRLAGDLNVAALGAALGAITARHEVLRTRLVAGPDGVAHQVIDPPTGFPLPVADVSGQPDPVAATRELIAADAVTPFDLAAGPLIRAALIRLGPTEHVLDLSVHHVVSDEWSAGILRRELSALYEAFRAGQRDPLPPLAVQYADFAVWQRKWLTGEVLDGQLSYWRDQLAGAPVLDLPADRPRPPVRSTAGAMVRLSVPAQTAAGLRAVARDNGTTMFMTLLAAFTALLGRYSGQDDIVTGTPVANRNRAETEDLIGFFVNTLVLRADLSGDPEFTGLLGRVRGMTLGAYAHQDLPFEQLVDALVTGRDRSRTPLFQVLFNYFTGHRQQEGQDQGSQVQGDASPGAADGRGGGAGVVLGDVQTGVLARFDLRLVLAEDGGGLSGGLEYSTALFDAATIGRMAGHLGVLLAAVAADPGRPLSGLGVLTAGERDELARWNDTPVPVPAAGGIHELAAARAAVGPDVVAVTCGGVSLSYGGLEERANRLAHYLRGVGVGGESVVGLCLERGAGMVVAMLAVWKAGGAYLPLDPAYPPGRLAFMLADSHASVLAGTAAIVDELPAGRIRVITLDDPLTVAAVAAAPPGPPPVPAVVAGQLAYVMYTSGLTGAPKGVQVTHGGVVNLTVAQGPVFGAAAGTRVLQFASFSFDAAVWEVCGALAAGATLVIAAAGERAEPGALAGLVRDRGVAVATLPPSLLGVLAPGELAGLVTLVSAGERLDGGVADRWREHHRLLNAYGPTEATVCASIAVTGPGARR